MTTADQAWQALADWQPQKLTDLVGADPEARLQALVRTVADIRFDFAKTHLDDAAIGILGGLAAAQDFAGRRKTLFSGGIANPTATLLSCVLLLDHLGLATESQRLEAAVARVYRDGKRLTPDQGGTASTKEMSAAVLDAYRAAQ